jgi:hypothetical protein
MVRQASLGAVATRIAIDPNPKAIAVLDRSSMCREVLAVQGEQNLLPPHLDPAAFITTSTLIIYIYIFMNSSGKVSNH